jgi:hypothetical protein
MCGNVRAVRTVHPAVSGNKGASQCARGCVACDSSAIRLAGEQRRRNPLPHIPTEEAARVAWGI